MNILAELTPIKQRLHELSLGEIMRGTRDLLGIKQWKLAAFLGLSITQMKMLESNTYREDPAPEVIAKFCEMFEYDFRQVGNQIASRLSKHKTNMQLFGKHPYYAKKMEKMKQTRQKAMENIHIKSQKGSKCIFYSQAPQ